MSLELEQHYRIQSKPFVLSPTNDDANNIQPSSAFPFTSMHSGYLYCRVNAHDPWNRMYFVVSNNYLLSAQTHLSLQLEETLYLDSATITSHSNTSFELLADNKSIYFKADTQEQSSNWINSIQKASTLKIKYLYKFLHVLGESGMTKVVAAQHKTTNRESAIKIVDKRICDQKNLKTEIQILKKLDNKYIVQLHDIIETKKYLYIVMEKCEGGELFDKIIELDSINETDSCIIMHQIARGVKYMHSVGIIHRDLKPENILCVEHDNIKKIKIADFGISKIFNENENKNDNINNDDDDFYVSTSAMRTMCTVSYTAPEILTNKKYDHRADYWSIGIILYILLCGYPPFYDENDTCNDEAVIKSIINDELVFDEEDWEHVSIETKHLLKGLLCKDPLQRKTCDDILKLVWKVTNCTQSFEKARSKFQMFNFKKKLQKSYSELPTKYNDMMDEDEYEAKKNNIGILKRSSRSMDIVLSPNLYDKYDFKSTGVCMVDDEYNIENSDNENENEYKNIIKQKWECNKCEFMNFGMDVNCLFCTRRWQCYECKIFNKRNNKCCILCHSEQIE